MPQDIMATIVRIEKRLDAIEHLAAFLVHANTRFKKGQRVRFSAAADRAGVSTRRKGRVRTGRIIEAGNSFTVKVLLDGYRRACFYHHIFFEPMSHAE